MTITCTPTPPVTPPCVVTICLSEAGKVTFQTEPLGRMPEIEFTEAGCKEVKIPAGLKACTAESKGHQALNIV